MTHRQTDILLTERKSHYRLICHRNESMIITPDELNDNFVHWANDVVVTLNQR